MRQVNWHLLLRELTEEPLEKFNREEGVEFQLFLGQFLLRQNLCIGETSVLGLADEPSLRESASQSTGKGSFAVEYRAGQLAVHHRIRKDQAPAWLKNPIQFLEGHPLIS